MTLKKEKENYFFFLNSDPFFTYLRLNSRTSEKDALKQNLRKNDTIVTTNSHSKACRFRKSMQTWTIIKHWLKSSCKTRLYNTEGFVGSRGEDVSLHWFTFNNRWLKLFIYSPLLSSVSLVCNLNWKRGQFGGKGDDARTGFSLDGRIKRKIVRTAVACSLQWGCNHCRQRLLRRRPRYERMWLGEDGYLGMREPQWGQEVAAVINSVSCVTLRVVFEI